MDNDELHRHTRATIAANRSYEALRNASVDDADRIPQDRLESFINNKYHWKGLTPTDQMKIAKELYALRGGKRT